MKTNFDTLEQVVEQLNKEGYECALDYTFENNKNYTIFYDTDREEIYRENDDEMFYFILGFYEGFSRAELL